MAGSALRLVLCLGIAAPFTAFSAIRVQASTGLTVIAVFNGGVIEYSNNDGLTWTFANSGTTADLRRGTCTTPTICWTVGSTGNVILKSVDAGHNWTSQPSPKSSSLKDVSFSDPVHGLIAGSGGVILTTSNGGTTWVPQKSGTSVILRNVALPTPSIGYVVGDSGVILATTNGGVTWVKQSSGTSQGFNAVEFVDATHGVAAGESGALVTTSDGGAHWIKRTPPTANGLKEASTPDPLNWYAVGNNSDIIASNDGGMTWHTEKSAVSTNILAMAFPNGDHLHGVANGYDGDQEITMDGTHWQAVASGTSQVGYGVMWTLPRTVTTLTSAAQPSGATVQSTLNDQATLSGGASPTGTITFTLYAPNNNTCTTNLVDTETAAVTGNNSYTTPNGSTASAIGTYQWVASYGGDPINAPSRTNCGDEPVTVSQATTSLTTSASPTNPSAGNTLQDSATLSGGVSPTGTITFTLYGPNNSNCTTNVVHTEPATVSGNGNYSTSTGYTAMNVGTYQWVASYGSDTDNAGSSTNCGDEPVTVSQAITSLTTTPQPATVPSGGTAGDEATLSGGASPTGTITFVLYFETCTPANMVDMETATVNGNGNYYTPTGATLSIPGTYEWVATYNSDTNNAGSASNCGNEPVTVLP